MSKGKSTSKPTTYWPWVLTDEGAKVVYDALGFWSSDDNDAPHEEIARLRWQLVDMGAVKR